LPPREDESCQISWPCPEKLSGPECTDSGCHAWDSDGGKPMTEVCGAEVPPWSSNAAVEPEDAGAPKSDGCAVTPPVLAPVAFEFVRADVATGGLEVVTGADRVAGAALECEAAGADACEPPPNPLPPI